MTKPNRLNAKANRAVHDSPTVPAPAFTAAQVAALRADIRAELRSTIPADPTAQAELARMRDALPARPLPTFDRDEVEIEVDAMFAE